MRTIALAIVSVLIVGQAWAEEKKTKTQDATDLLKMCTSSEASDEAWFCLGYIKGIREAVAVAKDALVMSKNDMFCIPNKITLGELQRAVIGYSVTNPPEAEGHTAVFVIMALRDRFPCQ